MSTSPIAVVAGGGKNLGGLISRTLSTQGYSIIVHYNSPSSLLESTATVDSIIESGGLAWAFQADLTQKGKMEELFAFAKGKGKVEVAINTVGKVLKKPLVEILEKEYDEMFDVNSKVAFFFIQHALKNIEDGGSIISIVTSLLAAFTPFYAAYQGSKAPVEFFTKSAAKEAMPRGVLVNAIAPGPMDTPFFYAQESDDAVAYHKSAAAEGRLTKIEDIIPIVSLLVQGQHWMNGQMRPSAAALLVLLLLASAVQALAHHARSPRAHAHMDRQHRNESQLSKRATSTRYVFAHVVAGDFQSYTATDWTNDITLAKNAGLDAFALNVGADASDPYQLGLAYAAAESVGGFKLFISLDMSYTAKFGSAANIISKYIAPFKSNPAQFNSELIRLYLKYRACWSPWFNVHLTSGNNRSLMCSIYKSDAWLIVTRMEQILGMANVPQMVELLTWNDFGESHYLGPIRANAGLPSGTVNSASYVTDFPHESMLGLIRVLIAYYKTGTFPIKAVVSTEIYWWYRPHPKGVIASADPLGRQQNADWTEDYIYCAVILARKTAVTAVRIEIGGTVTDTAVSQGKVNLIKANLVPGTPYFSLLNSASTVITGKRVSGPAIVNNPTFYNFNYNAGKLAE
ncbi:hypothetical protein RQP46_011269 [Phenoliferia psychrophenolica]